MSAKDGSPEWWEDLFDEKYLFTYEGQFPPERTRRETDFIIRELGLPAGSALLDVACGQGRHAVALALQGYKVTGIDQSEYLLSEAQKSAQQTGVEVEFMRADMREIPFENTFDAAVNMFTAFGYFASEDEDLAALRSIRRSLKPGGLFIIDLRNLFRLLRARFEQGKEEGDTFVIDIESTLPSGTVVRSRDSYNLTTLRWISRNSWNQDGQEKSYESNIRLYTATEISRLLIQAGFTVERFFGDFDSQPYNVSSRRMIVLARAS